MNTYDSAAPTRRKLSVSRIAGARVEVTITTGGGRPYWLVFYPTEARALRDELDRLLSGSIEAGEVRS